MRSITIIYDGTIYTYQWVKALFWAASELKKHGFLVKYGSPTLFFPRLVKQENPYLYGLGRKKNDILLMAFHNPWSFFDGNVQDGLNMLKRLKENCNRIVWLDTQDSTGTPNFEVLPYVDLYLKKQLLADLSIYEKKIYGSRLFADYLRQKMQVEDPVLEFDYTLLHHQYQSKLDISWNIGISDYYYGDRRTILLRPFKLKYPKYVNPQSKREYDFHFNGGVTYKFKGKVSPIVSFQRRKLVELINSSQGAHPSPTAKISHADYLKGVANSKAMFSPFGWGEICLRDFESMIYGNTLIKPDVQHLRTWPNFFVPNETYIPLDWELNNYSEVVSKIGSTEYFNISKQAQALFAKYTIGENAKELFANHLESVLSRMQ